MELALHFGLFFDGHSSLVLAVLALGGVLVVALTLEVRIILTQRFVLLEELVVSVLPYSLDLVGLLGVAVLEFVLFGELLVLVDGIN